MKSVSFKIAAAALAVASAFVSQANAAGFMLTEQSAGALGRAYAGVGVDGTDLSGVFYNPATMVLHPGTNLQAGFVGIGLNLDYAGNDGTKENGRYKEQAIPHGYITHQINDDMWVGLSMTVPFGMGTEYDSDWKHNDKGISATILTFDFNPNLAWKLTDKVSFGAGVSIQYAKADLEKEEALLGGLATVNSKIKADSISWGFNLGAMWMPTENFRVGVSYRSKVKHDADGDLTLSEGKFAGYDINTILAYPSVFGDEAVGGATILQKALGTYNGYATVTAPAWAMVNAAWDVNDLLSLYATFRWTDWSSFESLDITSDGTINVQGQAMPIGTKIQNKWKDTYLGSLGADLRLTDWWTLRGGIAYETSAVDDGQYRTAIIPDADRWWFAIGSSFKLDKNMIFDVSFAHLHGVHERSLYDDNGNELGKFRKLDAYLLGAQLQYKF